jgi:hypothetical protein
MPHPFRNRFLSRPSAPSCRGGASSLLRLAQPGQRAGELVGSIQRAAAALAPWSVREAAPSIITRLAPSRELGAA